MILVRKSRNLIDSIYSQLDSLRFEHNYFQCLLTLVYESLLYISGRARYITISVDYAIYKWQGNFSFFLVCQFRFKANMLIAK